MWEPLFTPFGHNDTDCQESQCVKCLQLEPYHGHINKTAFLAAKFASALFAPGSPAAQTARSWGRLTGLWHDLGKFAPHWQNYLKSKVDPHADELSGKVDHSTAGAILTHGMPHFGDILSYIIAGHHAGLADGVRLFPKGERLHKCVAEWRGQAEAAGIPLQEPIPC
ncbi:MAG: CRISPR-associated endonuclease Cas3'', partial [Verrucomicrobiaceae bacterium]